MSNIIPYTTSQTPTFARTFGPILYDQAKNVGLNAAYNYVYPSVGGSSKPTFNRIFGKAQAKKKKMTKKRKKPTKGLTVKTDGTSAGKRNVAPKRRTNKKKKKSVKKQIAEVRRLIPKMSTKLFRDFKTMCLSGDLNCHTVYDINCFDKTILQSYAANLTKVDTATVADYTASKSKLKMSQYYKLMCKNNRTANAVLSYAFFVCKDDDSDKPITSILEELTTRGYTNLPTVDDEVAASATSSYQPFQIEFDDQNPFHVPVFGGGAINRKWKIAGKVKTAILGPGDTVDLVWSRKNLTYNQEKIDQENAFAHIANYDVRLVISLSGDICHDEVNTLLVGRDGHQFDCEEHRQCLVHYANPKGLREVKYTDNLTDTGFSTAVHADNQASKIEQAEV